MNQNNLVISYLEEHDSITTVTAMYDLGLSRLANNISELRKEGYHISDEWVTGVNRYGSPCRYKRYFLEGVER